MVVVTASAAFVPAGSDFASVLYSAFSVAVSALPVASMPLACWNSFTADTVVVPKLPSRLAVQVR